jgi:hypothetical protein
MGSATLPAAFAASTSAVEIGGRHVDRHEGGVEPPGDSARVVEVSVLGPLGDVRLLLLEPVRHVDVGVDDDDFVSQPIGVGGGVLRRGVLRRARLGRLR